MGKPFAKVIPTRLQGVTEEVLLDFQCGFCSEKAAWTCMVFCAWQLMEKARERNNKIYMLFVNHRKVYDSVPQHAGYVVGAMKVWCTPSNGGDHTIPAWWNEGRGHCWWKCNTRNWSPKWLAPGMVNGSHSFQSVFQFGHCSELATALPTVLGLTCCISVAES